MQHRNHVKDAGFKRSLLKQRATAYTKLMRLHRPLPILLLLWPTLWALWIAANGHPSLKNVFIFVAGVIVMRTAGCIINDLIDHKIDAHVARTRDRPLAAGQLKRVEAWSLALILLLIALILVLQLNRLTLLYAILGLVLAIIYPFSKRWFPIPQVILGMAWYCGIMMAFATEQNHVPLLAWALYGIAILWAIIYDTFYAMADQLDDAQLGLHSSALLFGKHTLSVLVVLQAMMILALFGLGISQHYAPVYDLAVSLCIAHFMYQHSLAHRKTSTAYIKAFTNNHWIGLWIFLGIVISYAGHAVS